MSRCFQPAVPAPQPVAEPQSELLASLERINNFNPPVHTCSTGWTFNGFYAGPTSIAYLFFRLSQLYPDLTFKSQTLVEWATSYLELGSSYLTGTKSHGRPLVDPSHCGIANETLCQLALRSALTQDASLAEALCAYSKTINSHDDDSNEWLYGRAGYLYLLRFTLTNLRSGNTSIQKLLTTTISVTIDRILSIPAPWPWHGKRYLGAVHGSIGIMTQILLSSSHPQARASKLEPLLQDILSLQLPSGNFPSNHDSTDSDRLVQFCHGAPGVVLSLQSIAKSSPTLQTVVCHAIDRAQRPLLERGILTKPPCLCHGIPTTALALTSDQHFEAYMSYMSSTNLEANKQWIHDAGRSDEFGGLYVGEAGRAWAWAVMDLSRRGKRREELGVIGYNDL